MIHSRCFTLSFVLVSLTTTVNAHHPDRENQPVRQRVDVIPPLGNCLPMSYRREFNRPRNLGGKIAYHIAPSSQEAMAWHHATHKGYYKHDKPRMVTYYFTPKPWEMLQIGARPAAHQPTADKPQELESPASEPQTSAEMLEE
jgi:hypothetical protein